LVCSNVSEMTLSAATVPAVTDPDDDLPREPIDRLMGPLEKFLHIEAAAGVVLLGAAVLALVLANSPWSTPSAIGSTTA
jgi:hypothetical protein